MAVPIFDLHHVMLANISLIALLNYKYDKNVKLLNFLIIIIIAFLFINKINVLKEENIYMENKFSNNYYLTLQTVPMKKVNSKLLYYYNNSDYPVYYLFKDAYFYKLKQNLPINEFDFVVNGNNGYNATEKYIDKIKNVKEALFIVYDSPKLRKDKYDQTDYELLDFVYKNYQQIDNFCKYYYVYKIVN